MRALLLLAAFALLAVPALAQQDSPEARLREALRRATAETRALQDAQAAKDAELATATAQRDQALSRVKEIEARLAELEAGPKPDPEAEAKREAELAALRSDNARLRSGLTRVQSAYAEAVTFGRQKEAELNQTTATLREMRDARDQGREKNERLFSTASEILNLYRSQSFRNQLRAAYEPLLGLRQAELETLMQNYDDRIREERLAPPPRGPRAAPPQRP